MLQENIRKRRHLPHGPILGEGVVDPAREGRSLGQTMKQLITGCEDFLQTGVQHDQHVVSEDQ